MIERSLSVAVALAAVGCEYPPLSIEYQVTTGATQSCGAAECKDIAMHCEAVLSVRIVSPSDPERSYVSICELVSPNRNRDLCAIGSVSLPELELPAERLEVQVAVWPRSAVEDPLTGQLDCQRNRVVFDHTTGFPVAQVPAPAVGGHAYFTPGDSLTVVNMGCTDLDALNDPTCVGEDTVLVRAVVRDFDSQIPISRGQAASLSVAIGEPRELADEWVLNPADARGLNPSNTDGSEVATWSGDVDLDFTATACLEVLEDTAQATTSLVCRKVAPDLTTIDLPGIRLTKHSLDQILEALGMASFPEQGLTIGMVVDGNGTPVADKVVTTSLGTVVYLTADRTGVVTDKTRSSGIFVSTDAPYGAVFSINGSQPPITGLGGRVRGKVTMVVLSLNDPPVGT
ncbi:MAG: hypothetical protein AB7O24_08445 [Kofleriaceae bacterium]